VWLFAVERMKPIEKTLIWIRRHRKSENISREIPQEFSLQNLLVISIEKMFGERFVQDG